MYFWKIENLKQDIQEKQLTEKDKFIYTFISILFGVIGMELMILMPTENTNIWDLTSGLSNILIVALGILFAFKANGGAKEIDFLGKYFSISFVVSIRFLAILIPMFIGLILYYSYVFPDDQEIEATFLDTIPFLIWYIVMYWRIFKHIRDIKSS